MHTPDLTQSNIDKLAELFPTVMTESRDEDGNVVRVVNFDLLRQELSAHVVEGPQERYQLDWPGKREALFAANAPISKTLRPSRPRSVDFEDTRNLFIEGDNLDALKLLQESYLEAVKLIYIDPPYNTGNDFVYNDDFGQEVGEYLLKSGQVDDERRRVVANTESNGRFHSDWLSMMLSRLKLARRLLSQDGVIFMSIDDREVGSLRRLADEVFGESNFVAQVVWQKRTSPEARKRIGAGHEYVLIYARDIDNIESALSPLPLEDSDRAAFSNPDADPRGPWVSSDFTAPGFRPNQMYEIVTPAGISVSPPPGRCWMNVESEYRKQLGEGRFWFGPERNGIPRRKTYLAERNGKSAWTWWPNNEVGHTQEGTREVRALFDRNGPTYFDFPKPVRLIQRIVQLATRGDASDVVLDFFAGSGTTGHAVMEANLRDGGNRRFILVQLPEEVPAGSEAEKAGYLTVSDLSLERLRRAGAKVKADAKVDHRVDVGVRVLSVDTSNMTGVGAVPDALMQGELDLKIDSVKPDRTSEDLLFQVLLNSALDLSSPVGCSEIDAREVFSVDEDALIACFAEVVTAPLVREVASRQPLKAVLRDAAFTTDAERINAEQIFAEVSPQTDLKVI